MGSKYWYIKGERLREIVLGLFEAVETTSKTATEAGDTHGVVFIPAFNGLQTPINDVSACSGFLGLKPDTTKAHMWVIIK